VGSWRKVNIDWYQGVKLFPDQLSGWVDEPGKFNQLNVVGSLQQLGNVRGSPSHERRDG
jgi:hypothetical protein